MWAWPTTTNYLGPKFSTKSKARMASPAAATAANVANSASVKQRKAIHQKTVGAIGTPRTSSINTNASAKVSSQPQPSSSSSILGSEGISSSGIWKLFSQSGQKTFGRGIIDWITTPESQPTAYKTYTPAATTVHPDDTNEDDNEEDAVVQFIPSEGKKNQALPKAVSNVPLQTATEHRSPPPPPSRSSSSGSGITSSAHKGPTISTTIPELPPNKILITALPSNLPQVTVNFGKNLDYSPSIAGCARLGNINGPQDFDIINIQGVVILQNCKTGVICTAQLTPASLTQTSLNSIKDQVHSKTLTKSKNPEVAKKIAPDSTVMPPGTLAEQVAVDEESSGDDDLNIVSAVLDDDADE